ncbi:Ada metal-binding domain-containing protein [Lawsonibacter hominis]|uniref:Ada DNA repair metal-binding domain-containing protein n=1 Tax=Lawsonibacter hominis TaxID=2763053 RepID=A0A8J6J994_9FIRM|nr:hypothetical protein [Lawsonibacter hominis]
MPSSHTQEPNRRKNCVYINSHQEAIDRELEPCGNCNP